MKQMKVVDRANQLLDRGLDQKEAVATLVEMAPIGEKVEWFDEVAGQYLVYQLAYQRRRGGATEDRS
jgi:hypothetical protein